MENIDTEQKGMSADLFAQKLRESANVGTESIPPMENPYTEGSIGVVSEPNVFAHMPTAQGTIIGQLTPEELSAFDDIDLQMDALNYNPTVFTREETFNILRARRDWWKNITKAHNIPYAWPITMSPVTGEVYTHKK